jgi:DNA-binding MarR family transcriptional regulator
MNAGASRCSPFSKHRQGLDAAEPVSRRRDPGDRRRHIVELSSAGSKRLAEAERRVEQAEQRLLAGLSISDRGLFAHVLGTLVANTGITVDCDSVSDVSVDVNGC